jgi:hypothetical protein
MIFLDFNIEDALDVLNNIKDNPYGIRDSHHSIIRSRDRFVNLNLIYEKLYQEKPVAIEKEANSSSRFLLIYEYTKFRDLAIVIDILNENEIIVLTVIDKSIERRKH